MLQINQVFDTWFNKGFKGSKCKTLLKMASSRIKLLKNKRGVQLKALRKELAHLLENGQESTARIRVEHIIREQDIMEAYDILGHYCELLIVRMPIMESQRECPLDLREAVSSLIFAAPRASDLPELLEVQTLFSFKYGRDFVASATELRPDCGVNRLVIEKLSARAPTARVKLDLMEEIAEEHNVEWDSSSTELEFSKIPHDLLDGPNQFIGPIQMSPIPFYEGDLYPQESTPAASHKAEELVLPPSPKPLSSGNVKAVDPIEEPKFVPFVLPSPQYATEAEPNRFYSPPRESSITQQSGLLEETLFQRSHSRAKSEGSMNLQDIIEATEAAAESAEKAARAARAAAELCRSHASLESKGTILQSANTGASSSTNFKGGLTSDSYDWTPEDEEDKSQQNAVDTEQKVDSNDRRNTHICRTEDDYDWTVRSSTEKQEEEDTLLSQVHFPEIAQPEKDTYDFGWEAVGSSYGSPSFGSREEGKNIFVPFSNLQSGPTGHDHQPVYYDTPRFDDSDTVTSSDPFRRQPSLEDDPYYTYPNLFTNSSSGSGH